MSIILSRAVQLCVDIRVHNYDAINWRIVHSIAKNHIAYFSALAKIPTFELDEYSSNADVKEGL